MKYIDVIEELKKLEVKKIIVTGAQRSGTRFTTNIIGHDLGIKVIDELEFGINNIKRFYKSINGNDSYSVQAPALSHLIEAFPDDAIIIYMYRPFAEIFASQKRINWQASTHEPAYKKKYKEVYPNAKISWKKSLAEVKNEVWEKIQQKNITNKFYNLDYASLKDHPKWIKKANRKNFKANQIK